MKVLQLVSVMLFALVAGVFWGTFIEWTVATLPPDWQVSRDRWEVYHSLRTLLSVASLCSLVGSVLVGRDPPGRAAAVTRAA